MLIRVGRNQETKDDSSNVHHFGFDCVTAPAAFEAPLIAEAVTTETTSIFDLTGTAFWVGLSADSFDKLAFSSVNIIFKLMRILFIPLNLRFLLSHISILLPSKTRKNIVDVKASNTNSVRQE